MGARWVDEADCVTPLHLLLDNLWLYIEVGEAVTGWKRYPTPEQLTRYCIGD